MQRINTAHAVRTAIGNRSSVLVPTMGGLHAGHLALVRHARTLADRVVVSIYVNPLQFAPNEDYATYPRRIEKDCEQLQTLADIVYTPSDDEMYPQAQTVSIALPPLATQFCGVSRPLFFQGVTTVVCKLFNQCRPDIAVFGRKDYQQALLVDRMSQQLNTGVKIVLHPTVRAADGLALSSRNEYLTAEQRQQAPALYRTLQHTARQLHTNNTAPATLCATAQQQLHAAGLRSDYFAIRAAADLGEPVAKTARTVLAAAWCGDTRLIDNVTVLPDGTLV